MLLHILVTMLNYEKPMFFLFNLLYFSIPVSIEWQETRLIFPQRNRLLNPVPAGAERYH